MGPEICSLICVIEVASFYCGSLSENFHRVGIGPLSNISAVKKFIRVNTRKELSINMNKEKISNVRKELNVIFSII